MKKIIVQLIIVIIVTLCVSCSSNKKICPAYSSNNVTIELRKS